MKLYKNQSGVAPIAILLVVVIISVIGFAGYRVYDTKKDINKLEATSSTETANSQSQKFDIPDGFVEYKNQELGFKFSYPKDWGKVEMKTEDGTISGKRYDILFRTDSTISLVNSTITFFSEDYRTKCDLPHEKCQARSEITASETGKMIENDLNNLDIYNSNNPVKLISKDDKSYETIYAQGETGLSGNLNAYRIINLPKLNVTGAYLELSDSSADLSFACEKDKLSDNEKEGCISQKDVDYTHAVLESFQAL